MRTSLHSIARGPQMFPLIRRGRQKHSWHIRNSFLSMYLNTISLKLFQALKMNPITAMILLLCIKMP